MNLHIPSKLLKLLRSPLICALLFSLTGCWSSRNAQFDAKQLIPYQAKGAGVVQGHPKFDPSYPQNAGISVFACTILVPVIDFTREDHERAVVQGEWLMPFGDEVRGPISKCSPKQQTDYNGNFRLTGIPAGSYYVYVWVLGYWVPGSGLYGLDYPTGLYWTSVDVHPGTEESVVADHYTKRGRGMFGYAFVDLTRQWAQYNLEGDWHKHVDNDR